MISGYLDPASGSVIVSVVTAGAAGAGVAAKSLMAKMRIKKRAAEEIAADDESLAADAVEEPTQ